MASRSVCWRAGRSRAPPVSSGSRRSSRASSAAGGSTLTRAAASSIASGRPSSRRQIAATAGGVRRASGRSRARTARARSTNSRTAADRGQLRRAAVGPRPASGSASGGTGSSCSPREAQPHPAGGQHRQPRAGGQQLGRPAAPPSTHLLEVVEHQQQLRWRRRTRPSRSAERPVAGSRARPSAWAIVGGDQRRVAQRRQVDEADAVRRRRRPTSAATASARRVLPTPPGPVSVSSRDVAPGAGSAQAAATSRSRPTRRVGGTGSGRASGGPRPARRGPGVGAAELGPGGRNQRGARRRVQPEGVGQQAHRLGAGRARTPRSRSLTPRALSPARSASASWVRPAASRWRRSSAPKRVDGRVRSSGTPSRPRRAREALTVGKSLS